MIYQYCVDYPTCRQLYDTYYVQRDKQDNGKGKGKENAQVKPHLNTPTILLLCKRITREALGVLRSRYFILDRIPPWVMGNASPLPLIHFVSKTTLQNIKYFEFRVALGEGREGSGFIWIKVLRELLKVLSERNAVVEMKVMFTLKHIECWGLWLYELPGYERLTGMLNQWEFKHGHRPGTVQLEHWVIDYIYAYRTGFRNPLVRFYPDEVFWPGSVLEYL
ncbi:uncharacterized protein BCR38DRAFT_431734 [Pseudomassariella vexata]|uniref:Uncharacterized protein n=1 Tax=Pseudomassariella vexata TaxID=1141098 RepID=A0A1Y2E0I7_9PEZI|nr:uncharacterized protein BCR38DRAFT_431734 [Pseudomassariella vexata]ORY65053.1 hypothetical protein BCR38DRAFT_431734 [Pseudomassariella vexata]